ncbi:unnamed protein product [Microthlaspi erraticum]|uniref:Uncharacterized protein n=1 Tax=Microthlaspi erraticum TaxID=1685480 RepID=A0A6D2IRL0_9BRAS|nr:unnamed protein product [Microthlaspi erraticum]
MSWYGGCLLKITVWNEEVLLEKVELILEAFEYLQLPIALKQDVFICVHHNEMTKSGAQMWLRSESLLVRRLSLLLHNWLNCPGVCLW